VEEPPVKVALLADIHGNGWALDAVLADLAPRRPDLTICLGDITGHAPDPSAPVARLRELGCPGVIGNGDAELLDLLEPERAAALLATLIGRRYTEAEAERRIRRNRWALDRLAPADIDYLRSLRQSLTVPLGGGETLVCFHGTPQSNLKGIRARVSEADLADLLAGQEATVYAAGHTHSPLLRRVSDAVTLDPGRGEQLLINPGPIGGYLASGAHHSTARYALLTREGDTLAVEFRRVTFDARPMVEAAYASGMPDPEFWLYRPDHG
jgi:predicted phosphodiesterase